MASARPASRKSRCVIVVVVSPIDWAYAAVMSVREVSIATDGGGGTCPVLLSIARREEIDVLGANTRPALGRPGPVSLTA